MKFGIREVADMMVKTKVANQRVGNKTYPTKGTPICHFDTLKVSTLEGAATTVYATGGKGNPRLIGWDGERTITLTMEDALISKMGLSLLTGAGLIEASSSKPLPQHVVETVECIEVDKLTLSNIPYNIVNTDGDEDIWFCGVDANGSSDGEFKQGTVETGKVIAATGAKVGQAYVVDYYIAATSGLTEIDIEPNKFGGNYYFEGSTLWRDSEGVDHPADFVIPNGKIQSNFTFSMSSAGDPSTFTYTVDAFRGTTKHNPAKKVLCAILVAEEVVVTEQ